MAKVSISMVIMTYTLTNELEEIAYNSALSYRDQVDELIITEDGGKFSNKLRDISDIYIYGKNNVGFTANVNRGWRVSSGDYTMIVNSDTYLSEGKLKDLCIPGTVTSPVIENQYIDRLAGPFFVVPREVTDQRGYLMEEMKTYSSDSEYDHRVKDIFKTIESVKVYHEMARTVSAAGVEGGKQQEKDRKVYQKLIEEGKAAS